jgi:taurine dioxygenase
MPNTHAAVVNVAPITPAIGGVVEGVDLRKPLDPEQVRSLREAWLDRGVLFFRDQDLTEQQLDAFVAQFAQTLTEPTSPKKVANKSTVHGGDTGMTKKVTEVWHCDATWLAEPNLATALRMVKIPPVGGDTCWANVGLAYDHLIEPLRAMLDKLSAVHWMTPSLDALGIKPESDQIQYVHPVVSVHPETGRKVLFVNEGWTRCIAGIPPMQSMHLLAMLYDHIKSPLYTMRWRWAPGDVALWDNRAVQHFAVPDYDSGRVIQRVVTVGWKPRGPQD